MSSSKDYWRARELEALRENEKKEKNVYDKQIAEIYQQMIDDCDRDIQAFYSRYAKKEGISLAEAKKRASKLDIEKYGRKAKKYVKEKDFTKEANEEMRLYNMTMKVNRLELLKSELSLEMTAGNSEFQKMMAKILPERTRESYERQAGILKMTVPDEKTYGRMVDEIANGSFRNATWSQRIWANQEALRSQLMKQLTTGLIGGKNPREMARDFSKSILSSRSNAERLMRTELARVQVGAQQQAITDAGYDGFMFIATEDSHVCDQCRSMDGKTFKMKKIVIGDNAPPIHPNCRCSIAAAMSDEEFKELTGVDPVHTDNEKNSIVNNEARAIDAIHQLASDQDARYTKTEILDELSLSKVGKRTIDNIENSDVRITISDEEEPSMNRGFQQGNNITIFSKNIKSKKVAAQTIIHEMTHYYYNIGHCQHAEAICMAMEKMHLTGNDYVTESEWEYVKKLAIDNYPELNWEAGGYGDYEQFDIIRKNEGKR